MVDEVAGLLVDHLDLWSSQRSRANREISSPVLIHVDGPGRTLFLEKVGSKLDPPSDTEEPPSNGRWTVIRFDAWQYQRVAPPWWWLIKAIDNQLRRRLWSDSWWRGFGKRLADYSWRAGQLFRDLFVVVPPLLLAALLVLLGMLFSDGKGVGEVLQWTAAALAAVTALVGFSWTAVNALRRHLLVESPAGAAAMLRSSDPMADLERRYAYLIHSAGTSVAILIDNLDRCRADYVVELLEGIQTLFKDADADRKLPMVAFLAAADRAWLCDSYLHVYDEFEATAREPGRPFGLAFLDKIFNLSLRIPTVSAATSEATSRDQERELDDPTRIPGADGILAAEGELAVRKKLNAAEHEGIPRQGLRLCAVRRLAELEHRSNSKTCFDTESELRELAALIEPGPTIVRHLVSAYCVQRTAQLLGGHVVDEDNAAIRKLGAWTILTLRWPILAEHLERQPDDFEALCEGRKPDDVDEQLAPAFHLAEAQSFAMRAMDLGLDAHAISRFRPPSAEPPRAPAAL